MRKRMLPPEAESPAMQAMIDLTRRVARADLDAPVLIVGESGTGKELVALALHNWSSRARAPFVVLDAASINESLAESAIAGHVKGAFTGADHDRRSPFVEAQGGTLLIDEIGELPESLQPKLLRAVGAREVRPVGSHRPIPFDARVVAATNRDLAAEVQAGAFRLDLFHRLAAITIEVPPLRRRREDLPRLVRELLADAGAPDAFERITAASWRRLAEHDFPGNVRELESLVRRALVLAEPGRGIDLMPQPGTCRGDARCEPAALLGLPFEQAKRRILEQFAAEYFGDLVLRHGHNVSAIARQAGLDRKSARAWLTRLPAA